MSSAMVFLIASLIFQEVLPSGDASTPPAAPATPVEDIDVVGTVRYGTVVLECEVRTNGSVVDCVIVSEAPAGRGFGEAALQGARQARLSPRSRAGMRVGRNGLGRVRLTGRITLPN